MPHWLTNAVPIQGQVTRFSAADTIFHTSYYINDHDFTRDPAELSVILVTYCHWTSDSSKHSMDVELWIARKILYQHFEKYQLLVSDTWSRVCMWQTYAAMFYYIQFRLDMDIFMCTNWVLKTLQTYIY